jgi:hypothetical protein
MIKKNDPVVTMLDKYDKNNDDFVSIDEYLDVEMTKGPKASSSGIDYDYQDYANVYNYFMILFKTIKKFKIICIPNVAVRFGNRKIIRAAVAFDPKTNEVFIPNNVKKTIKQCENKKEYRFIFFSLVLLFEDELSHANMIVVDLHKKIIERFEPYGTTVPGDKRNEIRKQIDKVMTNSVLPGFGLQNYKYLSPINISEEMGIQRMADSFCGMCITISMMYFHMRVLNADKPQKKVIKYFTSMNKNKLKEKIKKYARHVERKLKENTKFIKVLNTELYRNIFNLT